MNRPYLVTHGRLRLHIFATGAAAAIAQAMKTHGMRGYSARPASAGGVA